MVEEKNETLKNVMSIVFLILLMVAIAVLMNAVITIYRYHDMLINPIGYSMKEFDLNSCSCIDNQGKFVEIKSIAYNSSIFYNTSFDNKLTFP